MKIHAYKKINKKEAASLDLVVAIRGSYKVVGFVTYSENGQMINAYVLKVPEGFIRVFADGLLKGCYISKWYPSYLENQDQSLCTSDPIPWGPNYGK